MQTVIAGLRRKWSAPETVLRQGRACAAHKPAGSRKDFVLPPQTDRSCVEKHTERDTSRVTIKISIRGTRRVPAEHFEKP